MIFSLYLRYEIVKCHPQRVEFDSFAPARLLWRYSIDSLIETHFTSQQLVSPVTSSYYTEKKKSSMRGSGGLFEAQNIHTPKSNPSVKKNSLCERTNGQCGGGWGIYRKRSCIKRGEDSGNSRRALLSVLTIVSCEHL